MTDPSTLPYPASDSGPADPFNPNGGTPDPVSTPYRVADVEPVYPDVSPMASPQLRAVITMAAAELKLLIDVCGTGQWTAVVTPDHLLRTVGLNNPTDTSLLLANYNVYNDRIQASATFLTEQDAEVAKITQNAGQVRDQLRSDLVALTIALTQKLTFYSYTDHKLSPAEEAPLLQEISTTLETAQAQVESAHEQYTTIYTNIGTIDAATQSRGDIELDNYQASAQSWKDGTGRDTHIEDWVKTAGNVRQAIDWLSGKAEGAVTAVTQAVGRNARHTR